MCSVGTYLSVAQKASEYIFHDLREKKKLQSSTLGQSQVYKRNLDFQGDLWRKLQECSLRSQP